jgi:hypothetical protein
MNNSVKAFCLSISLLMASGCASIPETSDNPESVRCTTAYEKQIINSEDLNDNAIAFLFGKDKDPKQYRDISKQVFMTVYGSPFSSDKCQRWMMAKSHNETRTFDLDGWSLQKTERNH